MNSKKYLVGSAVLLCGLLTACGLNKTHNNTLEELEELNADGFIALNNNDKEDSELQTSKDGRFTYRTNHVNGITIVSDGAQINGELTIPDTIDGYIVTKIGLAAYANSKATKIVIPDSVKIIESMAFNSSTTLKEVVLGANVVEVGDGAFMNCYGLADITLNEGLYRLGHSAFSACYDLKSIDIPDSVELIDKYCFTNSGISKVKLPEKLYFIAEGSFMGCSNLEKVTIPESLAIIDHLAFADCPNLEITLNETCGQVCSTAFQGSAVVKVNPAVIFEPQTLTYDGDFSEFENPQIVKYFYTNTETESASNE